MSQTIAPNQSKDGDIAHRNATSGCIYLSTVQRKTSSNGGILANFTRSTNHIFLFMSQTIAPNQS